MDLSNNMETENTRRRTRIAYEYLGRTAVLVFGLFLFAVGIVLLGVFMDLILDSGVVPAAKGPVAGFLMMAAGLFVISFGSYFYIRSAFGAGPRDSLLVALRRHTGLPVGLCRVVVESAAVLAGWLLGGPVGLGTVVSAFGIGLAIQITFSLLRFEAAKVRHETFADTFKAIKAR